MCADQSESRVDRKRVVEVSSDSDSDDSPLEKKSPKTEDKTHATEHHVERTEYVSVILLDPNDVDGATAILVPRGDLTKADMVCLKDMAGTRCFDQEVISADETGLLATLYLKFGGKQDYIDLCGDAHKRVLPSDKWITATAEDGVVSTEESGQIVVFTVMMIASGDGE